jgi:DNA-binding LacI/PurR family transcriptional regulator
MKTRADIAEVARHARVSKSTVSRVINGGYASPEVRARVVKVIQ